MFDLETSAVPWAVTAASAALAYCAGSLVVQWREHFLRARVPVPDSGEHELAFECGEDGRIRSLRSHFALRAPADSALAKWVAPEDQPLLEAVLAQLRPESPNAVIDLRVAAGEGRSAWQRWRVQGRFRGGRRIGFTCVARDVTREKSLEQELDGQKRVLRALCTDAAWAHAILETDGDDGFRVVHLQRSAKTEMAGELWGDEGIAAAPPEPAERMLSVQLGATERQLRLRSFPLQESGTARIVACALDDGERQRTERALLAERKLCNEILAACPAFLLLLDSDDRIARINPAMCEAFGYAEGHLIGRDYTSALGLAPEAAVADAPGAVETQRVDEGRLHDAKGEERLVDWRWRVVRDERGERRYRLGVGFDVTEQRRNEDWLARQHQQLVEADKILALGSLISGLAHEIGNPNHVIQINAPLLRETWHRRGARSLGDAQDEAGQMLDEVLEASNRIRMIVHELHAYARGEGTCAMEPTDVNEVVRLALTLVASPLRRATRSFGVHYAPGLPIVQGNMRRLEQVLINLVLNACQALTHPHQAIRVETAHDAERGEVVLTVRDEGSGIRAEHLGRVLDAYFTTKGEQGGTGLGLAIARHIAERHGGRLELHSEFGRGTTARLHLPVPAS
jgi:PAS domain S-box-containing protein